MKSENLSLESRVVEVIDTWTVSLETYSGSTRFNKHIKPVLYGLGIDVTKKLVAKIESKIKHKIANYLDSDYHTAVDRFRKDFLARHYAKCDYSIKELTERLDINRNTPCRTLKNLGIGMTELKDLAKKASLSEGFSEYLRPLLMEIALKEINGFRTVLAHSVGEFVRKSSFKLAESFVAMAINFEDYLTLKKYDGMSFKEAQEKFKADYLIAQFYRCGFDTRKAAESSGMTERTYRAHITRKGLSFKDLRKAKTG